jgi:hypothetical protein
VKPKGSDEISPISKRDAVEVLAKHGVDFTMAKKHADTIEKLSDSLHFNDNTLVGIASVLLAVDFLINQQTNCGNDDLDGSVARALGSLVYRCADEIKDVLALAGEGS